MAGGRPSSKPSNIESLLIAQAVWEHGNAWDKVAAIIEAHPLVKRSSSATPQWCESTYDNLMKEAGLERTETCNKIHSPINHKLAEKYYRLRLEEIRDLILSEEAKFKEIVAQIDAIRSDKPAESPGSQQASSPREEPPVTPSPPIQHTPTEIDSVRLASTPEAMEHIPTSRPETTQPTPEEENMNDTEDEAPPEEQEPTPQDQREESEEEADRSPPAEEEEEIEVSTSSGKPRAVTPSQTPSPQPSPEGVQPGQVSDSVHSQDSPEDSRRSVSAEPEAMAPEAKQVEEEEDVAMGQPQVNEEDHSPTPDTPEAPIPTPSRRFGKRKSLPDESAESPRDRKRAREGSEAEDDEPGLTAQGGRGGGGRRVASRFQTVINHLHAQIGQHRYGNIFQTPIKPNEAPGYYDIVRRPIDLKTIKNKIKDGKISNSQEYYRDVLLMFANAMMFNRPGSDVHNMAEDMMRDSEEHYQNFRTTEFGL